MQAKTVVILFILSLTISITVPSDVTAAVSSEILPVTVIDPSSEIPTYYAVDIPWFYQETSGSCGAAALKSAFGQLSYSVDESEIRIAAQTTSTSTLTGDMVRAAHFSNTSEEGSGTVIQGYTGKPFGTESYEISFDGYSTSGQAAADEFLKQRLLEGKPVILLMSYRSGSSTGHYRVLRGYDDRTSRYTFTDSAESNPSSGSHWTVNSAPLYANFWNYSGHWAQVLSPWSISLTPMQNPTPGGVFRLNATIDSGLPSGIRLDPWSLQNASIQLELPSGYSLSSGAELTVFGFNSSGKAQVSWDIQVPPSIENNDRITAGVKGWINGTGTHPWQVKPFAYCDIIYSEASLNLVDWTPPMMLNLNVSSDTEGVLTVNTSLIDDNSLQNISLQWRMSATNWTTVGMQYIEGSLWQTTGIIPPNPSGDEILQFRVLAQDNFDNQLTSSINECHYTFTTETPTEPILFEFVTVVAVGIVAVIVIVMIYRQRSNP